MLTNARPFVDVKDDQWVSFELSLTRLSAGRQPTTRQMVTEHSCMLNGSRELAGGNTTIVLKDGIRSETNRVGTKRRHEL